jgi:hypothetical protein
MLHDRRQTNPPKRTLSGSATNKTREHNPGTRTMNLERNCRMNRFKRTMVLVAREAFDRAR